MNMEGEAGGDDDDAGAPVPSDEDEPADGDAVRASTLSAHSLLGGGWADDVPALQAKSALSPTKAAVARAEKARLRELKKRQEEELERVRAMQNEAVGSDSVRCSIPAFFHCDRSRGILAAY